MRGVRVQYSTVKSSAEKCRAVQRRRLTPCVWEEQRLLTQLQQQRHRPRVDITTATASTTTTSTTTTTTNDCTGNSTSSTSGFVHRRYRMGGGMVGGCRYAGEQSLSEQKQVVQHGPRLHPSYFSSPSSSSSSSSYTSYTIAGFVCVFSHSWSRQNGHKTTTSGNCGCRRVCCDSRVGVGPFKSLVVPRVTEAIAGLIN